MNAEKLKEILRSFGWKDDGYGHMKKEGKVTLKDENRTVEERQYRVKFQANSVRVEVRCDHQATEYSPKSHSWVKLCGDYFKNIRIMDDGRLKIGSRLLKGERHD